jgi:ribosome maturation factor RimP
MINRELAERIERSARPVVASMGFELVEVVYQGGPAHGIVRLIVDKPGGIGHDECESVSRIVGTQLDIEELVPSSYTLEVSSPGLDRRLKKPEEYDKYRGRTAKIKAGGDVYIGRLEGLDGGCVAVRLNNGEARRIPLHEVRETQLVVEVGGTTGQKR